MVPQRPYLAVGLYDVFLDVWWRYFPKAQLMVIRAEDYYARPGRTLEDVFAFAKLPRPSGDVWRRVNNRTVSNRGHYGAPMHNETRALLEAFYRPHRARLHAMLRGAQRHDRPR